MFNSQIMDVAIGLVFIYFLLSLICSVIIEGLAGVIKKRPRMLYNGIFALLGNDANVLDKLYQQPLFMGNTAPKSFWSSLWNSLLPFPSRKTRFPSYLSSRIFVLSLLASLKEHPAVVKSLINDAIPPPETPDRIPEFNDKLNQLPDNSNIKKALVPSLASAPAAAEGLEAWQQWYDNQIKRPEVAQAILKDQQDQLLLLDNQNKVRNLVNRLPDDHAIRKALIPLLESATNLDKALSSMEKWYDEAMDRVTGWYKRYSQLLALILAFFVALGLNADTFQIGKALYRDQTLRSSIVAMAQEEAKKGPPEGHKEAPAAGQKKSAKGKQKPKTSSPPAADSKSETAQNSPAAVPAQGGAAGAPKQGGTDPASDLGKRAQDLEEDLKEMKSLNLPMGWDQGLGQWNKEFNVSHPKPKPEVGLPGIIVYYWSYLWFLLSSMSPHLPGIIFTALMVSLGANFWFELMSKVINMRNAGKKPLATEERSKQGGRA